MVNKKYAALLGLLLCFSKGISAMSIAKKILSNGLTILVKPNHTIPKVSIQLWYNVGSKDEKDGEKGIAHLIEHMIFKGTKKMLSESDIKVITHMLSGSCNAFTSYDYTGYLFELPSHNWRQVFPIMADCMVNAAFNDEHLNSEMKAVIQELKMLKDNHTRALAYDLLTTIFPDHPYHYPLIGYKQDLWSVKGSDLERFYKKHYAPNNATLVLVGDVDPEEVFALAQNYFGTIPANETYEKKLFYHNKDIAAKSVTLYRDIAQPTGIMAFVIPGSTAKIAHVTDVVALILGGGRSSRLYKKLVDELELVSSLYAMELDLFDHGLFLIMYTPNEQEDIPTIEKIILETIEQIAQHGVDKQELVTALNKAKMSEYSMLEKNQAQAQMIGKYYLATGDPEYAFNYLNVPHEHLNKDIQSFVAEYFRPSVMHTGLVLPLPEGEKQHWTALQEASDALDNKILSARVRTTPVEPPKYAQKVQIQQPEQFDFPKAQEAVLANGMKVLWYENDATPKINMVLEFKAKHWYDPEDKQGLYIFVTRMMFEGTEHYTAEQLANELESRGMTLSVYPGGVSMAVLKKDINKGLELLNEMLTKATFPEKAITKVRNQMLSDLKQFWDDPRYFATQLTNEIVYKGHPFAKNSMGTVASLASITRDDLLAFYHEYISPTDAKLAIVGDLAGLDVPVLVGNALADWHAHAVPDSAFPALQRVCGIEKNYPINRDQVSLTFAGPSVDRKHPDYDKLLLFDQIFGGGALGSLHSRLFQLREQSGLFYTINGSTVTQAGIEPGMVVIRTLVSVDRLKEAEKVIKEMIETVADTLTDVELAQAKNALAQSLVSLFDSNTNIAQAFLFLDKYGFAPDYFDKRAQELAGISLDEVKAAAKKWLAECLAVIRVGRV